MKIAKQNLIFLYALILISPLGFVQCNESGTHEPLVDNTPIIDVMPEYPTGTTVGVNSENVDEINPSTTVESEPSIIPPTQATTSIVLTKCEINADVDGDGELDSACAGGTDCDDNDPTKNTYTDGDGDGYATCPKLSENKDADCDDTNPQIHADLAKDSGWKRLCQVANITALEECPDAYATLSQTSLRKINGEYKLVYRSCLDKSNRSYGLATSTDLTHWTLSNTNPIWGPLQNNWNNGWISATSATLSHPNLIYDEVTDNYILYGHARKSSDSRLQIFCATSNDGENFDWNACSDTTPALAIGAPGSWDDHSVSGPYVIYDAQNMTYHMFYTGRNVLNVTSHAIGSATSPDGINWTKNPNNPLMAVDSASNWADQSIKFPTVLYDPVIQKYIAMYQGATSNSADTSKIGLAYFDTLGDAWIRQIAAPVLEAYGGNPWTRWDSLIVNIGDMIMLDDDTFMMVYSGQAVAENVVPDPYYANTNQMIGFALNTRPKISNLTPANDLQVTLAIPLTFAGKITDDYPETVRINIESQQDGPIGNINPNTEGQFNFTTSALSSGQHLITITATDLGGIMDVKTLNINVE